MTSSSIIPYNFEGNEVVVFLNENDEPCFIANSLAKPLGLSHIRQHLARLDDDEKGVTIRDTPGGQQQVAFVTEPGLYRLIFASRKEEAKRFKRWVYHEVLPAIRRDSAYVSPNATPEQIEALQQQIIKLKQGLSDAQQVNYWLADHQGAGRFLEQSLPDGDRDE